ncbi:hypothetical protein [Streptomyces sp. NPDC059761]|uniref:hypothetical protein n=1 Tax=Streptomyces sp. NPDC059761 TaxID=3346937 RepID=UPI00364D87AE
MTQPEPTLGQLWQLIERDSQRTREQVQQTLTEVKTRLDSFMTKELWESEKRLLVQRIEQAEDELQAQEQRHNALKEKLDKDAEATRQALEAEARSRRQSAREFIYKGIIPCLALLTAVVSLYLGSH